MIWVKWSGFFIYFRLLLNFVVIMNVFIIVMFGFIFVVVVELCGIIGGFGF